MLFETEPERMEQAVIGAEKEIKTGSLRFDLLKIKPDQLESQCQGDPDLEALLFDVYEKCDRYNETVLEYKELIMAGVSENPDRLKELEDSRSRVHQSMIDSVNILARNLTKSGKDAKWIKDFQNRAVYGRFAILTSFTRLLESRRVQRRP